MSGSSRPAETSLTTVAPVSSAARATAAFVVSTLIGTLVSAARRSTTGSTRRSSSSAGTGAAPGRVDSPPTSRTSAPCPASAIPCATASSGSRKRPPSENESGVTLTIPMTAARAPHTRSHSNIQSQRTGLRPRWLLGGFRGGFSAAQAGLADEAHGLGPGGGIVLEHAAHCRRDGQRPWLLHPAHRHAEVLGLDDHEDVRRQDVDERIGDLGCEALLNLGPLGEPVDHARQLRQACDPPVIIRDVRDVRPSVERDEVVLAVAGDRDVADHHHLVVIGLEGGDDVTTRVLAQPAENLLVHVGDPPRRVLETVPVRVLADGFEDLPHRALDARFVELSRLLVGRDSADSVAHSCAFGVLGGGRIFEKKAEAARRVLSHGRTSAKTCCTRSVSRVSCSIRSDARRSSTARFVSRIWRASLWADSIRRRTSASMLAATSSE